MEDKKMSHGGVCESCGGMVDADGYAMGGEIDEGYEQEEREPTENPETEQQNSTQIMRDAAFADAIRNSPRSIEETHRAAQEPKPDEDEAAEMRRAKMARYGFGGKK